MNIWDENDINFEYYALNYLKNRGYKIEKLPVDDGKCKHINSGYPNIAGIYLCDDCGESF